MFRADPLGCACVLALQVTWVSRARADDKPSWVRPYGAKGANRSETSYLKDGQMLVLIAPRPVSLYQAATS